MNPKWRRPENNIGGGGGGGGAHKRRGKKRARERERAILVSAENRLCEELLKMKSFLVGDGAVPQAEQSPGVGDDYTDDEIGVRERRRLLMDEMIISQLVRLEELNNSKEVADAAKQMQYQEELRKMIYRAQGQEVRKARGFFNSVKHSNPRCINHSLFRVNQP